MTGEHWGDADLINRLYEVGPDDTHLGECEQCRERWLRLIETRMNLRVSAEPPAEFFVRQREAIIRRIERPLWHQPGVRLTTALAGLAVVGAGLLFVGQDPQAWLAGPRQKKGSPAVAASAVSDSQLAADIASLSDVPEERAAKPMSALFNE